MANNSAEALAELQGFQGSMAKPVDVLTAQQNKLGIPAQQQQVSGLRQAITNTTNLLNQIPSSVQGRTGGSLVTSAQAGRQVANESAPVAKQLSDTSQNYNLASADLNTNMGQASQLAGLEMEGQNQKLKGLQSIYDALYGREQSEAEKAFKERQFQEQIRQANEAAKRAAASGGGYGLGGLLGAGGNAGAPGATPPKAGETDQFRALKQSAYNELQNMFGSRRSPQSIMGELEAIRKSAGFGNLKDKLKLELIATGAAGGTGQQYVGANVLGNGGSLRY